MKTHFNYVYDLCLLFWNLYENVKPAGFHIIEPFIRTIIKDRQKITQIILNAECEVEVEIAIELKPEKPISQNVIYIGF